MKLYELILLIILYTPFIAVSIWVLYDQIKDNK